MNIFFLLFTLKIGSNYKGYDFRYPLNETDNILEFKNNYLRKFLLTTLESNANDIYKLDLLQKYKDNLSEFDNTITPNILNGGLLDDWEFYI